RSAERFRRDEWRRGDGGQERQPRADAREPTDRAPPVSPEQPLRLPAGGKHEQHQTEMRQKSKDGPVLERLTATGWVRNERRCRSGEGATEYGWSEDEAAQDLSDHARLTEASHDV